MPPLAKRRARGRRVWLDCCRRPPREALISSFRLGQSEQALSRSHTRESAREHTGMLPPREQPRRERSPLRGRGLTEICGMATSITGAFSRLDCRSRERRSRFARVSRLSRVVMRRRLPAPTALEHAVHTIHATSSGPGISRARRRAGARLSHARSGARARALRVHAWSPPRRSSTARRGRRDWARSSRTRAPNSSSMTSRRHTSSPRRSRSPGFPAAAPTSV